MQIQNEQPKKRPESVKSVPRMKLDNNLEQDSVAEPTETLEADAPAPGEETAP